MKVSWDKSRKVITVIWFSGGSLLFFVIFIQTILGRYDGYSIAKVWQWFLPTIVPTLSLIIGVFVAEVTGKGRRIETVDRFFAILVAGLSLVYLTAVACTIFLEPLSTSGPIELMEKSNMWLGPLQGLVVASLGGFFIVDDTSG